MRKIQFPELFFGFVAPIGASLDPAIAIFEKYLEARNYRVVSIKITDIFPIYAKYLQPHEALERVSQHQRYMSYIEYGNQLREELGDEFLAASAISRIVRARNRQRPKSSRFQKTAYLLHQFKRKEEIELLRAAYGRLFFQISAYSRRGARVDTLTRKFGSSENTAHFDKYRSQAEAIVQVDEEEVGELHGQRVGKIFHDADFILNIDSQSNVIAEQINRFCDLVFSANKFSPTKMEYGMFAAKAAALRSLDVSRQVGAAIFTDKGEVVTLGCNEVPKAGGGTYWAGEGQDARDCTFGVDPNEKRKKELLSELAKALGVTSGVDELMVRDDVKNSQFMDALEYGRIIHAEMSALSDAARLGRSVAGGILYCTTFPCHMCAKHIVGAGLSRVVFLEPYPKSLTADLHQDSVEIEGSDRGAFKEYPGVRFEHFCGITPRRYRDMFERGSRKVDGKFQEYRHGVPEPLMDIKAPFYFQLESDVLKEFAAKTTKQLDDLDASQGPTSKVNP